MPKKHLAVFVANGFEETELITALDIFGRAGMTYDLIGVEVKGTASGYAVKERVMVKPDMDVKDMVPRNYYGIYIPGGSAYQTLEKNPDVLEIIKHFSREDKFISAICAGPEVLRKAGILEKIKYTSHPTVAQGPRNTGKEVETTGHVFTGRDFRATPAFADQIVNYYKTNKLV